MTAAQPKLTIQEGQPETIALKYATGKRVRSRFAGSPDQYYCALTDGRSLYLPWEVGLMIDRLHPAPGEPLVILKRGPGDWSVVRKQKNGGDARRNTAPLNSNERSHDSTIPGSSVKVQSELLRRCYQDAIGIALDAAETAKQRGLMIVPTFEDVRCISSVLMIAEARR